MAPKHGLNSLQPPEDTHKRAKTSSTTASRSVTPAEAMGKVDFVVHYPNPNSKKKLNKKEQDKQQELLDHMEWQESPFVAKGRAKDGELDQHYTVTPSAEWAAMKKYNNFISRYFSECLNGRFANEFTVQGEVYKNNHFVYVRSDETPSQKDLDEENLKVFWVARILQVRAQNAQHVYALVRFYLIGLLGSLTDKPDCMDVLGRRIASPKDKTTRSSYSVGWKADIPRQARAHRVKLYGSAGCAFFRRKGGCGALGGGG